jgi:hypothetical protein
MSKLLTGVLQPTDLDVMVEARTGHPADASGVRPTPKSEVKGRNAQS